MRDVVSYMKGKGHSRTDFDGRGVRGGGVEVLLYSFIKLGARWRWLVKAKSMLLYLRERDPVVIVQEGGWIPVPVWRVVQNLTPIEILSPDRPTSSESLKELSCPGAYLTPTEYRKL